MTDEMKLRTETRILQLLIHPEFDINKLNKKMRSRFDELLRQRNNLRRDKSTVETRIRRIVEGEPRPKPDPVDVLERIKHRIYMNALQFVEFMEGIISLIRRANEEKARRLEYKENTEMFKKDIMKGARIKPVRD